MHHSTSRAVTDFLLSCMPAGAVLVVQGFMRSLFLLQGESGMHTGAGLAGQDFLRPLFLFQGEPGMHAGAGAAVRGAMLMSVFMVSAAAR